jgi:aspartyl-tRNA(Asn)/glutamyl-tRNA(Gln) amidotransferase subunit B
MQEFEAVIGLEIHIQLKTQSKAFCADSALYGESPNTLVSAISLGHPGTLPMHNISAIEYATKLGLALHCNITQLNGYARKNYFYADLPKGYQISQDKTPICTGGFVEIPSNNGNKKITITRIHMEEDSGKSMHDQDLYDSLIDYNRAGVPLVELVSEPEIRSGEEAYHFVSEIRKLVRYLEICDGNMEEGSMRCDANISIRPVGSQTFGTKVEVKNMNSMTNVKRAIEFEIKRQTEAVLAGEKIVSETRSFNAANGSTISMRSKEEAQDYRYFPEPDLPPFIINQEFLDKVKISLPELPKALFEKFTQQLGLSDYDAQVLTEDRDTAAYFTELYAQCKHAKTAANWILGPIKSWLNEQAKDISLFPLNPTQLSKLIQLVMENTISHTAAVSVVLPELIANPSLEPIEIATKNNILQNTNSEELENWVLKVLESMPEKVAEYQNGKKGLLGLFVGEVMKLSKGSADPKKVNEIVRNKLD